MINIITKRLKLNVTNIRSSLIFNRKKIKKINSEKNKFVLIKKNQEDITKKESKIESSDRISVIQNIGKKLLSGPLSLIDKFKEFFGLILLGIVVNNLPTIVQKLQDVFEKIKTFFDQNPWIGNTIKFAFDIIGKGIMGLAKFIKFVRPYVGGSFKFALDTIRSTKNQIGSLIETFDELNLSFGGLIKDLDVDKIPDVSKEPEKYSAFIAGGGKSSVNEKGQSVDEVVEQGRKNISKYDTKPIQPTQTKPPVQPQPPGSNPPVQKLARGGTVGSIPPSEGTGRGGPSDVAKTAPYLLKPSLPRTPFARPGGTAIGKRTIRTINYFEKFKENVSNSEETSKQNEKNNNSFFNILKKLNEIKNLRLKVKDDEGGRDGGAGGDTEGPGSGGGLSSAEVFEGQGADRVWNFFKGHGLSDIAVSGIMGNAQQESGFNPTIAHSESIQGKPAKFIGIFQWDNKRSGDRWGQLVKWAKASNLNPESIDTQLKWTWKELSGPESLSLSEIKKAQTPEQAAQIWYKQYERASHGLTERQNYAKGFYKKYKGKLPTAIKTASQAKLRALPPTNTRKGQAYGDGRPRGGKHAGVDFDIKGNETFYSRLGGEVINVDRQGTPPDGYGNYVDIYNKDLNLTERIAEGNKVLVKKGDSIAPGTPVAQGESRSGVIHYEIRKGRGGYGFEGTLNPIATLNQLGLKRGDESSNKPGTIKPSPISRNNLNQISNIIDIMTSMGVNKIDVGGYKLYKDKTELKIEDKDGGFLGLFAPNVEINKSNFWLLKKLENDLKYIENIRDYRKIEGGGNASIKPIGKTGDMVASLLNTKDPNDPTNYVLMNFHHNTIVKDTQTIAMRVPVYVQESVDQDSTSSIFSQARDLLS